MSSQTRKTTTFTCDRCEKAVEIDAIEDPPGWIRIVLNAYGQKLDSEFTKFFHKSGDAVDPTEGHLDLCSICKVNFVTFLSQKVKTP